MRRTAYSAANNGTSSTADVDEDDDEELLPDVGDV